MGVIIPFPTKNGALATEAPSGEAPPEERRQHAEAHVRDVCRRLLNYYHGLGDWTPACEAQMVTAVRALMMICYQLTPVPVTPRGDNDQV
jgi:hypothetical protein